MLDCTSIFYVPNFSSLAQFEHIMNKISLEYIYTMRAHSSKINQVLINVNPLIQNVMAFYVIHSAIQLLTFLMHSARWSHPPR